MSRACWQSFNSIKPWIDFRSNVWSNLTIIQKLKTFWCRELWWTINRSDGRTTFSEHVDKILVQSNHELTFDQLFDQIWWLPENLKSFFSVLNEPFCPLSIFFVVTILLTFYMSLNHVSFSTLSLTLQKEWTQPNIGVQ